MVKWAITMFNHFKVVTLAKNAKTHNASVTAFMPAFVRRIFETKPVIKLSVSLLPSVVFCGWRICSPQYLLR